MAEREELIYSYEEFHKDCGKIAEWAKDKNFKSVFGVRRGGLVVAVELSHRLDLPLVVSEEDITKDTLIVDDLIHTGDTAERLFMRICTAYQFIALLFKLIYNRTRGRASVECLLAGIGKGYRTAVLFYKEGTKPKPDFYVRAWTMWVRFPWETEKSSRYDGTIRRTK